MLTDADIARIESAKNDPDEQAQTVLQIAREVAAVAGLDHFTDLFIPSRKQRHVTLRWVVMYRASEMGCSLSAIAKAMRCDKATVINGIRQEREARK